MAAVQIDKDISGGIQNFFCSVNNIAFVVIAIYHIYSTRKFHQENPDKKVQTSLYLSFVLLIICAFSLVNQSLMLWDPFETLTFCSYIRYTTPPSYMVFKLVLYTILICRLHEAFGNTMLQYNPTKLKLWALFLIIAMLICLIITAIKQTIEYNFDVIPHCVLTNPISLYAYITLLDITAGTVNSILFIKPVLKLRRITKKWDQEMKEKKNNENGDDHDNASKNADDGDITRDLKHIAEKQCLLTIIAIGSTFIAFICLASIRMAPFVMTTDINISFLSIILMYNWNSRIMKKIFGCCLSKRQDVENLERIISVPTETAPATPDEANASKYSLRSQSSTPNTNADIEIVTDPDKN